MTRKLLIFVLLVLPAFAFGQVIKTAAIPYTGSTAFTPNISTSSELRIDTATSVLYWWNRNGLTWMRYPHGVDITTGGSAPAYTPRDNQGRFAINADNELYYYTGSAWVQVGGPGGGGIYGGSGSVPDGTVATLVDDFEFTGPDISSYTVTTGTSKGGQYFQNFTGATISCRDTTGDNYMSVTKNGIELQFDGSFDRLTINDRDARYGADYSATYSARSLVDKAYVDLQDSINDLDYWVEAYTTSTATTASLKPAASASNISAAIVPKGNGAITAAVANGSSSGGNARGTKAADFQIDRNNSAQVASGTSSTVSGGRRNTASASYSVVGGGSANTASAQTATVTGGDGNTASNTYATVAGGVSNTASEVAAIVAGGAQNTASGNSSFVGGGQENTASAQYACVIGGRGAEAYLSGQFALSSFKIAAAGDAQTSTFTVVREVTGTAQTELFLDGASIRPILKATNRIWNFRVDIVGVCNTVGNGSGITAGDSWVSWHSGGIKRINTTTSLIGTVQAIATAQADAGMATSAISITADDTNEAIAIKITPPSTAGSTTVTRWVATVRLTEVAY